MTALSASVFTNTNHLFLRAPDGGVEDVANMKASGFGAIFCNIGDYPLERWDFIRSRAVSAGVVCGPWLRIAEDGTGAFDPERLGFLIDVADEWGSPLIVNGEAELKGSGDEITTFIADEVKGRDAALSMEPWPFANVDWRPVGHLPILPQIFGDQWGDDAEAAREEWFRCGVSCVVNTFGTYGGSNPNSYDLLAPYGLYTADDCGNVFAPWSPIGTRDPYAPDIPPTNGGELDMETIGEQHGITGMVDLWRKMWPANTNPDRNPDDLSTWKAIDKIERTLLILARDHDDAQ